IYEAMKRITSNTALSKNFTDRGGHIVFKKRTEYLAPLFKLHELCSTVFMDYNPDAFNGMCVRAAGGYTVPVLEGCLKAAESFLRAQDSFLTVIKANRALLREEDVMDYFSSKAGALIDNVDMLSNWCMYKSTAQKLAASGLTFITDALENGKLKAENVLAGFEKNVYKNFLEINLPADPNLSRMTVGTLEDTIEKFRLTQEEYSSLARAQIRKTLISRLPDAEGEGNLDVEISAFRRLAKSNLRGTGIRGLLSEIPTLIGRLCPCLLMSPITVAQYLQPVANSFDLVIFDEASQMSTAEAVGSIARAKSAIVVGDPKQLPPTAFFRSTYVDEENLENEDLESVLDDCLALGMKERHLLWHYRSKHESLIAFSNSMYYDNKLCTFPSPDSLESKVRLIPVDGVYDRGFTKRNKKEAEALVKEVIRRLQDPALARSSMGVVTFSGAQQEDIERLLTKEITAHKLESIAYDREEPLFVKNLENVQGDERDVILFSVCYGPDKTGRVSLNF
ncbi:MAG: DNA2/NAM7 family helicase, partial [Clostridiales bacterium]|nr:DNA2/NAM7 family helicase [Clostridiales bacterium]